MRRLFAIVLVQGPLLVHLVVYLASSEDSYSPFPVSLSRLSVRVKNRRQNLVRHCIKQITDGSQQTKLSSRFMTHMLETSVELLPELATI